MTLFFIAWGNYPGFRHAVRCAVARANCPVIVVSDLPPFGLGERHVKMSNLETKLCRQVMSANRSNGWGYSVTRWLVLKEAIATLSIPAPVFLADWDMLMFTDLAKACEPFAQNDFAVSIRQGDDSSAAYLVNRFQPLLTLCDQVESMARAASPRLAWLDDMALWRDVYYTHGWSRGDLFTPQNNSVFDHNIVVSDGKYMMDGEVKSVLWKEGNPHFLTPSGDAILAHCLHCWGPWKGREELLCKEAGIP